MVIAAEANKDRQAHLRTAPAPDARGGGRARGAARLAPTALSPLIDPRVVAAARFDVTGTMRTDGRFRNYAQVDVAFGGGESTPSPAGAFTGGGSHHSMGAWGTEETPNVGAQGWGWGGGFSSSTRAPPRATSVLGLGRVSPGRDEEEAIGGVVGGTFAALEGKKDGRKGFNAGSPEALASVSLPLQEPQPAGGK